MQNSRIENVEFLDPSLIVSRALTSTKNLLMLSIDHMLKSKNIKSKEEAARNIPNLLFLKGKTFKKELNDILKALYETNFFKKISLKVEDQTLVINVDENKIIQSVRVEGVKSNNIKVKFTTLNQYQITFRFF